MVISICQKVWQYFLLPLAEYLCYFLFLFVTVTSLLVVVGLVSLYELFQRPLSHQEISCLPGKETDLSLDQKSPADDLQ